METIGLIAAMAQESRALFKRVKGWRRHNLKTLRGYSFRVGGRDCLLVQSGMGVERAYQAACQVIEEIRPDLLVSFGIAGAVQADLKIGDVVSALNTCDIQVETTRTLHPLAHLSNQAWQAAALALQPVKQRLWAGTAVTTRGSQTIAPSPEMVHPVLEMETSGILRAAREKGLPLLVLRAVSDNPESPIPINLEEGVFLRIQRPF